MKYEIKSVEYSTETWGIKEDVGGRKIVTYDLYFNNEYVGEFTYSHEEIPDEELKRRIIHDYIIQSHLPEVMDFLSNNLPDEEFILPLCEDDFFTNTKHDIRAPYVMNDFQTKNWGTSINGTYVMFLKKNWETIKKYYEG